MQQLILFLCILFFAACNSNTSGDATTLSEGATEGTVHAGAGSTINTNAAPFVLEGCYEMTLKKDSAFLQLHVADTLVSGTLEFNFHEKDRNTGSLRGVLRNNLIIADYTFQSEGITSVRELVFQIHNNTLLQGFGDLQEQDGKLVFQDKNKVQYHTNNPFIKVACP